MANQIKYQVGFVTDKTGLKELEQALQTIIRMGNDVGNEMDKGLQDAAVTAKQLMNILNKSYNKDLGTINVTKFNKELNNSSISVSQLQSNLSKAGAVGINAYNKLGSSILSTNIQLKESNKLLDDLATSMANTVKWGITSSIFNTVTNAIQKAYNYSVNLNTSLNDIRIVTGKSADEMNRFAEQANTAAKNLGASTLDYTNAALIYYQQGLDATESAARAETTLKAANVTGQTGQEVSEQLTAVWNGYKVSAEETELYVDKLAAVAASTASDLEELSTGMSKVASAANNAGVDIDQLNGILSTVISATREAPETIGSSFKTIFARLGDLALDGEDEYGVSLGKVSGQLHELGIEVLDQKGEMRDMGDIIEDTAAKWQTWTQAQRQAAAVAMAGKMQYSRLIALFDNWDKYSSAVETSKNAIGTLQEQQDIYMESTTAKLKTLKATWQDLYDGLIDEQEIGAGIDSLANLVQIFDNFIDSFGGGIKSITAFGAIVANIFNKQIGVAIANAQLNQQKYQQNLDLLERKKEFITAGTLQSKASSIQGIGEQANYETQILYAQKIQEAQKGISSEQYNQLTNLQQQIGQLEQEAVIIEKTAENELKKSVAATEYNNILEQSKNNIQILDEQEKMRLENIESQNIAMQQAAEEVAFILKYQNLLTSESEEQLQFADALKVLIGEQTNKYQKLLDIVTQDTTAMELDEKTKKNVLNLVKKIVEENKKDLDIEKEKSNAVSRYIQAKNEANKKRQQKDILDIDFNDSMDKAINSEAIITKVTAITSSLSMLVISWSSVNSLFQTWNDETASFSDKMTQTFMTIGMAIPTLISSFKNLNDVLSKGSSILDVFKAKKTLNNALDEAGIVISGKKTQEAVKEAIVMQQVNKHYEKRGIDIATVTAAELAETKAKAANWIMTNKQAAALKSATAAQTAFNASLLANPLTWVIAALGATVAIVATVTTAMKKYNEAIIENADSSIKQENQIQEEINSHTEVYNSLASLYKQYKQGEIERSNLEDSIQKAIKQYKLEGTAVAELTGNYDLLIEKIKEARNKELEEGVKSATREKESAESKMKAAAKKGAGLEQVGGGYFLELGVGYSRKDADADILQKMKDTLTDTDFTDFDYFGYKTVGLQIDQLDTKGIIQLYDQLEQVRDSFSNLTVEEKASSELYQGISNWLDKMTPSIKEYKDALADLETYQQEFEIAQKDIDFYNVDNLEDYINKREELNEQLKKSIPDEERRSKAIDTFLSTEYGDSLNEYTKQYKAMEELVDKFGEDSREKIKQSFKNMTDKDWEAFYTLKIDEIESLDNLDQYLEKAKKRARENKIETSLNVVGDISGTLLQGKTLSDEQNKNLEKLQKDLKDLGYDYKELASIQDKSSNAYIEKLLEIQEALEQEKISIDKMKETESIENISKIDVKADETDFKNTLKEIAEQDYSIVVDIKADIQSDFDNIVTVMDNIENMANKIGDDFIVAASDLEELNDVFPGITEGMQLLNDGTVQLASDTVQIAMNAAQDEVNISRDKVVEQLQIQQKELEGRRDAAQAIANIADSIVKGESTAAENEGKINEALNKLKQDNAEESSRYEQETQIDVAQQAADSSSSMANNYSKALNKMLSDQAAWAKAARQNLIYGTTTEGGTIEQPHFETSFKSESGVGTIANAKKGEIKSGDTISESLDWGNIRDYYQNLANSYNTAIQNTQGKIAELYARSNKLNTETSNIARGLGSDGKSKSSSGGKTDVIENLEDEKDIYHDIDIVLKQISVDLDRLQKQQDKLFGQDLINNLNQQLEKLNQQINATGEKIKIAKGEASELRDTISVYGASFNADGTLANYTEIYTAQLNYVNSLIDQYNSMSKEGQDAFKDTVEGAKKSFDKFVEDINKYDTLISDTIPGLKDDIQDAVDKQIEIKIEEFTMEIKIRLDMSEAERDWNEFRRKVIDGIKDTDILGNTRARLRDFNSYYNSENTGEVQSLMKQVQNTQAQLEQMDRTGWSDFYGDNRAQGLEDLKSYNDQLMKSMEDVEDLIEEIKKSYLDMMDEAADKFQDQVDMYEQVKDIIDHDMNIIKLVYGEDSYADLEKYYQMQEDNNNKQLDFLRQQKDFWYAQMQTLEQGSEEWEKAKENWMNAVSEWNSKVEEAVENIQDKYLNTINKIFDELNNKVTSGAGLDHVSEEWELINKNADQYLDTINSLYGIQSLENKYLDAIDRTDNLSAQRKLNDLMNEELDALREKDKLTQYDIDRANMKYEIALKQIALEEAQQNKSTMRLRRDSQGNYTYQYVADNDQIGQLQDELTTLKNELYNFDLEHYRDNLDQVLEIYQEFQEKMKEAAQINDPEERAAMELLLQEQYGELINGLVEQNETIRLNLHESAFTELADLYNTDLNNFQSLISEEQEVLLGQMIPQWDSGIQHMADTFAGEGGFIPTCKDAIEQLNAATETYEQDLNQVQQAAGQNFGDVQRGIDDTKTKTEELIQDNGVLIQTYQDQLNEVQKVINELQSLCSQYNAVKIAAQQAAEAAYNYWRAVNNQAANAADNNTSGVNNNPGNSNSNSKNSSSSNSGSGGAGSVGGDGATIGNQITYSGSYYYDSFGTKPSGSKYSGVVDGVTIDIVNNNPYGIHIKSSDGRYPDLGWIKRNQITRWNTGGYTGDWGDDSGRLAILDRKELILNKNDTANMLNILQLTRDFMNSMNNVLLSRMINSVNGAPNTGMGMVNEDTLEQNVHIDATFPNVKDAREVEEALNNLVNVASQRIGRNTKR